MYGYSGRPENFSGSYSGIVILVTILSACFNLYNFTHFGAGMDFDSREYLSLAQSIASGGGFSHTVYRTPLYPALIGLFTAGGDGHGYLMVIVQHILVVLCVPMVYGLSRMFGFSPAASYCIRITCGQFTALQAAEDK